MLGDVNPLQGGPSGRGMQFVDINLKVPPELLVGEVFPLEYRSLGTSLATAFS